MKVKKVYFSSFCNFINKNVVTIVTGIIVCTESIFAAFDLQDTNKFTYTNSI